MEAISSRVRFAISLKYQLVTVSQSWATNRLLELQLQPCQFSGFPVSPQSPLPGGLILLQVHCMPGQTVVYGGARLLG